MGDFKGNFPFLSSMQLFSLWTMQYSNAKPLHRNANLHHCKDKIVFKIHYRQQILSETLG